MFFFVDRARIFQIIICLPFACSFFDLFFIFSFFVSYNFFHHFFTIMTRFRSFFHHTITSIKPYNTPLRAIIFYMLSEFCAPQNRGHMPFKIWNLIFIFVSSPFQWHTQRHNSNVIRTPYIGVTQHNIE